MLSPCSTPTLLIRRSFDMVFTLPFFTLLSLSAFATLTSAVTVQKPLLQLPPDAAQNRETVKDMFLSSYNAYKRVFPPSAATDHLICVAGAMHGVMMTWLQSVRTSLTTVTDGVRPSSIPCPPWWAQFSSSLCTAVANRSFPQYVMGLNVRSGNMAPKCSELTLRLRTSSKMVLRSQATLALLNHARTTRSGDFNHLMILPAKVELILYFIFSVFETTVRYLGGLLSAYELSNCEYPGLLIKAEEVADTLSHAWVGVGPLTTSTWLVG